MKKEITYDSLLEKIPNKYILTIISGERAREIERERIAKNNGQSNHMKKTSKKETDMQIVFKEILDGKISYEE